MKDDEKMLLRVLQEQTRKAQPNTFPDVLKIVDEIEINGKRASYILLKWSKKNWYDYGVNVMFGWLTKQGLEVKLPAEPEIVTAWLQERQDLYDYFTDFAKNVVGIQV